MKRIHIHIGVDNLDQSIRFYNALFKAEPSKVKDDYAKWMLDDPSVNFAISTRPETKGLNHLGLEVDSDGELDGLRESIQQADIATFDEGETVCCYARSEKTWVQDPAGIAWEAYHTMADAELFNNNDKAAESKPTSGGCC